MMAHWNKLLNSLGFSDSEAKIYLISLEMGPSPVQELAKKADVSRVTTYTVIESLMAEGLMSTVQKGKKTLYTAESPERLVSYMHERIKGMEGTLRELESTVNELKLLHRGEKPVVKMLEGIEGLKALTNDMILSRPKNVEEFCNRDSVTAIFSAEELAPLRQDLDKQGITGRFIYTGTDPKNLRKLTQARKITRSPFNFSGDIMIYGNKVAMSALRGKLITVIIESEDIADTMRAMFELAWTNGQEVKNVSITPDGK